MFVIVYEDMFEGFQGVVGPFKTHDEAEIYMESHNLGHYPKIVVKMESP